MKPMAKVSWMFTPSAETMCAIVDTRADDHARPRLLEPEPQRDADGDRHEEHEHAAPGVVERPDVDELGVADEASARSMPASVPGVEVGLELVEEDHGDRDRDQGLAELLALRPAQKGLLRAEADDGEAECADQRRQQPFPGRDLAAREAEAGPGARELLLQVVGDQPPSR